MSLTDKTKRWLNENCNISMKGKNVLVTGANSGVGFKTAEISAYLGADVILACRSMERAKEARLKLISDNPEASISIMQLDLASLSSIEAFFEKLVSNKVDIDVFVNNAGAFRQPDKKTEDGFDLVIGTNYIATYYLSELLLPYLSSLPHEVVYVNTISIIHKIATVDYTDFYYERGKHYHAFPVYARSKLCLARYTYAQAKRYAGSNVCIMMNHPGMTITPMGLNALGNGNSWLADIIKPLSNSPEKSALSIAYILSHEIPAGSIIGPNKGFGGWGYPEINHIGQRVKEGAEELIRFTNIEIEKVKYKKR